MFAFAMSTLLVFYFAGRFVLVRIVATVAPSMVPYFIAAYTLAALMLTVLIVAKTTIRLGGYSMAARGRKVQARFFVTQAMLCLAHLCVFFAAYTLFSPDASGEIHWTWLLAPLLYAAGIYGAVIDLRQRAAQATG